MRKGPPGPAALETLDPRWYARLFDYLGARYDELPFTHGAAQEAAFLVSALRLGPPDRVLDAGCGTARHAIELAVRGLTVTGVDLSLRMLEVGLASARARDAVVNLMHADVRELAFEGSFDVALSLCQGAFGLLDEPGPESLPLRQTSMESRRQRPAPMAKVREALVHRVEERFGLERLHVYTDHPLIRRKTRPHVYAPSVG